jgi:spore germination cell wall hydrolase CwlJ-like protein
MNIKKGMALAASVALLSFIFGREVLFVNEQPRIVVPVVVLHAPIPDTYSLSAQEQTCMADMAYHEARGEGVKGIAAVIHVTLNRKDSNKFPKNICQVVYQRIRGKCQYSWVCEKKNRSIAFRRTKEYQEIILLTQTIASVPNRIRIDPTHGSLYYKRADVASRFFRTKLIPKVAIGSHRFYVET